MDGQDFRSFGPDADLPTPLRRAFDGKHLMVTGVTGFLGKVWLAMVLEHIPEIRRVTVLARGRKGEDAHARMERIVERHPAFRSLRDKHGAGIWELFDRKIRVVHTELSQPLAGFSQDEAETLMADIDMVVHFAGLTDFEPDPDKAIEANIHGASHMADLAALSPTKKYLHCSTCFVAGRVRGEIHEAITPGISPNGTAFSPADEIRILERSIAECTTRRARIDLAMDRAQRLGWPNIYTFTKGLAEHLIAQRDDLEECTVRPAIVECARSYPFRGWNEGINTSGPIVWLLSSTFRRLPARPSNVFDVVPVDTVARATTLAAYALFEGRAKPVYQVASGMQNPLTFERGTELTSLAIRKHFKDDEDFWMRNVIRKMDGHCGDADRDPVVGVPEWRRLFEGLRKNFREADLQGRLPGKLWEKHGEEWDLKLREWAKECRAQERKLQTVDEMLRQFRPFIHELDYRFQTKHLKEETEALDPRDRALFGFDIDTLCWRDYWINTQVPGLEQWSIPVMRGDKVPDDAPLERPAHTSRPGVRAVAV